MSANVLVDKKVESVDMERIYSDDSFNCRGRIVPHDVLELADDIEKHGLHQPIIIQPFRYPKPMGEGLYDFRIVIGHRRHLAFKVKQWPAIPAIIAEGLDDLKARALNLSENLKRKDLNILQEAQALVKFREAGYTLNQIAKELGVSSGWVQTRIALLDLPKDIQLAAGAGFLTQDQIKQVASLPSLEEKYEATRIAKDSKLRGEKKSIVLKKPKINPNKVKQRNRVEMFEMQNHIRERMGNNIATRALAWAAGEISSMDFYVTLKKYADSEGIPYSIPTREEMVESAKAAQEVEAMV